MKYASNMKPEQLKKQYEEACNEYIKAFCKKQDLDFECWIGESVGGICMIGDMYFNFLDIVWDINSNQPKGLIVTWYDEALDSELNKGNSINYFTFTKLNQTNEIRQHNPQSR